MISYKSNICAITCITFFLWLCTNAFAQNEFYNKGSAITVQAGALITVQGNIVSEDAGANIGLTDNSGLITFSGNWTNNSPTGALMPTTGFVELLGANQSIGGSQPTRFNHLTLSGSGVKILNVNTYASGATALLNLTDRPLDLNSHTLFVTNPLPGAITRTTGYIISETAPVPGYGIVQWNVGNNTGNYIFPFGSLAANYIPFTLNINVPGASSGGAISASTYPTNTAIAINNRPLPTGVANLNNNCGTEHAPKMLDRFWVIDASNYSTNPTANKQFSYIENEWDVTGGSTNLITENNLQAWHYNSAWTHIISVNNSAANNHNISNNTTYGVFTLGEYHQFNMQLLNVDSVVCFGESNGSVEFTSNQGYGAATYSINGTVTTNTLINTLAAGAYTIVGMDAMGCTDTIHTIQVEEPLKLLLSVISDKYSVCKNDAITLTASFSGGIKPYSVTWSNGGINNGVTTTSLTQQQNPQATGNYWVWLNDYNNCKAYSDTIAVNVNPLPVVSFTSSIAEGCQPLPVSFTNLSAATPTITSWLWNFDNGDFSTLASPDYTYTLPGTFVPSLKATTDSGCVSTFIQPNYILVHPKPVANFYYTPASGIDVLNPEITFQNASSGFDNSSWNFGDGSPLNYQNSPMHMYTDTGVYIIDLIVSTIYNCTDTISTPLKVNEISTLYVPNAFTPDGNSLNDVFVPIGLELYDFKMLVFDRWGEKIFESPDINIGWDGKHKGAICKEGVYVYRIEFKEKNGVTKMQEKIQYGHITLLKAK